VRSHLVAWEIKKNTQLSCEADFEVKIWKTPQVWSTSGLWDVEKKACRWSTFGSWAVKKNTPMWCEAHFEVNMLQTLQVRNTFVSRDVEKMDVALERSTCKSQNICNKVKKIQNTPVLNHFWKFSCWKNARRCSAKHILKSRW
jgi:hypothetical protein